MHSRDIKIFQIAGTALNRDQIREWVDEIGATEFKLPGSQSDGATLVGLASKRCYMSFQKGLNPNINRVRKSWFKYLQNVLKQGHGSVAEHASYTFAVENVTRVFTGEMNRHRAGVAISEGSMRYIRFDDIPFWMPHSLSRGSNLLRSKCIACKGKGVYSDDAETTTRLKCSACCGTGYEASEEDFQYRKKRTREIFNEVFANIEERYKELLDLWEVNEGNFDKKKKLTSLFRRIVPMGVCTGVVYTLNIRALRHVIGMRSSPAAEEEICYVATTIAKHMVEDLEPALFADFELDPNTGCWQPQYWKV